MYVQGSDSEKDVGNLLWMESSRVFQATNNEMVCAYSNDRKMRSIAIKTQGKVRKVKFAKLLYLVVIERPFSCMQMHSLWKKGQSFGQVLTIS